jgi:DNA-binding transcriptional LysR family regulator
MTQFNTEKARLSGNLPSARHLRIFEAVARLESVTKAAEEVRLSQPAVTQAIAKLEGEVGKHLLDRCATGTYLTEFGHMYLARTRRFFGHIENALSEISAPDNRAALLCKVFRITRSQMRCHIMIARSQSFAQAAAEVGISQASLHRAARDLELNLGVTLYRNSASGMVVTEAGKILARGLLLALNEMQSAVEEMCSDTTATNTLAIGINIHDPAPFLAAVIERFTRDYPDCAIKLVNSTAEDMRQRLRLGLLDFVLGFRRDDSADLQYEVLFRDPYVVAARSGHPLTKKTGVTAADLVKYNWVVPNSGAPRRQAFEGLFSGLGAMPRTMVESHSYATIRAMLCEGDWLAILTRGELRTDERMGVLAALSTPPLSPTPAIGLTTRTDWLPTQRQQAFLDLLREQGAALYSKAA